jgi:hypothetical protein
MLGMDSDHALFEVDAFAIATARTQDGTGINDGTLQILY